LYLIEVEGKFAGDAAVHPRLQIRGPILADHVFSTAVVFAHPSHSGVDGFSAIYVLNGMFAEEEVHKFTNLKGADEVGL